jgi:hypothetical protein
MCRRGKKHRREARPIAHTADVRALEASQFPSAASLVDSHPARSYASLSSEPRPPRGYCDCDDCCCAIRCSARSANWSYSAATFSIICFEEGIGDVLGHSTSFYGTGTPMRRIVKVPPGHRRGDRSVTSRRPLSRVCFGASMGFSGLHKHARHIAALGALIRYQSRFALARTDADHFVHRVLTSRAWHSAATMFASWYARHDAHTPLALGL